MTNNASTAGPGLPTGVSLQSALPVAVFLGVNRLAGLRWAVAAATIASIVLVVNRRRRGQPLGKLMPLITAAVLIRGLIGVLTGSETVYFGLGIATKYVVAAVLLGSVLIGTPIAARVLPFLMRVPETMAQHRTFPLTMALLTAIAGAYYAASATLDVWLFRRSSVEGFVLLRFLASWPLTAVALVAMAATAQLRLQRIPGTPPLPVLVEQRWGLTGIDNARN